MATLDDHVVLITGAGSGLGLGIARHFAKQGASLALFEISAGKVADLRTEFGDDVVVVQGDITSIDDLARCRSEVLGRFGRIDGLVGAHGIFDGNVPIRDIPIETLPGLFDEVLRVNSLGYILVAKTFVEDLAATSGAIVLTASTAAWAADGGGLMYTASKGAVRSTVNQLAFEFAPDVRVNGVAPATIAGSQLQGPKSLGMQDFKQSDIPKEAFLEGVKFTTLMGRMPEPEDYAPLYEYLVSRANRTMTGQTVICDQGLFNRPVISAMGRAAAVFGVSGESH